MNNSHTTWTSSRGPATRTRRHPAVSTVIPGARNVGQARSNAAAGEVPAHGGAFDAGVQRIYNTYLREVIHPRW